MHTGVPIVLTKEESLQIIGHLSGTPRFMAKLLYGGGLRLMKCVRLRVKDLDFAPRQIVVQDGKGIESQITMLPESLLSPLLEHLSYI